MNGQLIETLNCLGEHFLAFAWPMLWQSSLLIALILAVDISLARKLRASIRHALWLVVLVKLLLPPTLALPTGAAWWLFPAKPAVKAPTAKNYVVTFEDAGVMPPTVEMARTPSLSPPPPRLDQAGWMLLAASAVSTGLLLWLLFRWAQVVRMVCHAKPCEEFCGTLLEVRRLAGLRRPIRVKMVDERLSPAVCGLFRPAILLPRTLAENLSGAQLCAVLLHEAMHLRRMDIWVNCAQALLQVAYWWHPLVWLANARIRRVREEAVDDAVMLALDADAEIYAPTLLAVARLAFQRPRMSLGLVGILESRSALRQRIERLLMFRAPRKAGLTLASLCGILAFSAVALPMGEGPARVEKEMAADASPPLRGMTPPAAVQPTNPPAVLVQAEIYEMPMEDLKNLISRLHLNRSQPDEDDYWSASPEEFSKLQSELKQSGLTPLLRPRIQTSSGKPAQFFVGNDTHGTEFDCLPVVNGAQVNLAVRCEIADPAVTNRVKVNAVMQNRGGMVMRVRNDPSNAVVCLSVEILTNTPSARFQPRLMPATKPSSAKSATNDLTLITRSFRMNTNVFLVDETNSLSRSMSVTNDLALITRSFRMNTNVFLVDGTNSQSRSLNLFRKKCGEAGVDWQSPPGKACFVNGLGYLFVRTTKSDLDLIEKIVVELNQPTPRHPDRSAPGEKLLGTNQNSALSVLNQVPSQVHIKAWFYEAPKGTLKDFGKYLNATNPVDGKPMGILTSQNAMVARQALQSRKKIEVLGEPEVTMLSGRHGQMRATTVQTILTYVVARDGGQIIPKVAQWTNQDGKVIIGFMEPQTITLETGPILDVNPRVLADGHSIHLTALPSFTEFLGYAEPTNAIRIESVGYTKPADAIQVETVSQRPQTEPVIRDYQTATGEGVQLNPVIRTLLAEADLDMPDGATLILQLREPNTLPSEKSSKELLVFITATMVDPAGNRVHSDDEMPYAQDGIPPQPQGDK
jgi:beta-lactamase regulating signal transducer with metallopeptidase domain